MSAQPTIVIGTVVLIAGSFLVHTLTWYVLLAPFVWFLQMLALIGTAWILSLLNVVLRDLTHGIAVFLIVLLIASPIAYTPEMVPPQLKWLLAINPFAYFVVVYQELIVLGQLPTLVQMVGLLLVSSLLFGLGGALLRPAKSGLLDYV